MNDQSKLYFLYVVDAELVDEAYALANFTNLFEVVQSKPPLASIYLQLDSAGLAVVVLSTADYGRTYVHQIYARLGVRYRNLADELLFKSAKLPTSRVANSSSGNVASNTSISSIPPSISRASYADNILWDLTAGLGKDALILAAMGYNVTMFEQHPVLATILYYALDKKIIPAKNLHLIFGDSYKFLQQTVEQGTGRPNVIYLDFMFKHDKSAKAKKDMQLIQLLMSHSLFGEDSDKHDANNTVVNEQKLFTLSYQIALNKIIVKRENKQEGIVDIPKPTYSKQGKTIRFDVY
ncbi:MAG: rRNA (guanine1516-N2)-methyltransferase [Pseudomonadota bacterium]|nr:rRNA (guanine1516-N2)-methyltransferase [Pseudomonadota bacterium]